ncbi:8289_t:CDS:2 [Diversispora eburnea]|uniref:8289_t:CDS:1 n=1 Tax=Diversispora eburnea TaxID=1213867 RepID=A0A9N9AY09_9GLOM|nr:8289_t:CDS:2 [Diversispora eburnea]
MSEKSLYVLINPSNLNKDISISKVLEINRGIKASINGETGFGWRYQYIANKFFNNLNHGRKGGLNKIKSKLMQLTISYSYFESSSRSSHYFHLFSFNLI